MRHCVTASLRHPSPRHCVTASLRHRVTGGLTALREECPTDLRHASGPTPQGPDGAPSRPVVEGPDRSRKAILRTGRCRAFSGERPGDGRGDSRRRCRRGRLGVANPGGVSLGSSPVISSPGGRAFPSTPPDQGVRPGTDGPPGDRNPLATEGKTSSGVRRPARPPVALRRSAHPTPRSTAQRSRAVNIGSYRSCCSDTERSSGALSPMPGFPHASGDDQPVAGVA